MRALIAIGVMAVVGLSSDPGAAAEPVSAEAARWQALAEKGDGEAALQLALLYDTGHGVPQSFAEAERWYRQAAEGGNAVAAFDLAALLDSGRDGDRNAAAARHWYQAAADRGMGRAAYLLGVMLETGDGGAVDTAGAANWYRKALAAGITAAQGRLTRLAAADRPASPMPKPPQPSPQQARREAADDFGHAVGRFRAVGIGSDADAQAALERAATDGVPLAEYDLAYACEHGLGRPVDIAMAYGWYQRVEEAADAPPVLKASAAVNRQRLRALLARDQDTAPKPAPSTVTVAK